jgi:hypothetical protein
MSVAVTITLTVADMRKIAEHELQGAAFRLWITPAEYAGGKAGAPDWTYHQLSDGRWAMWRRLADLNKLRRDDKRLYHSLRSRMIEDDVT